MITPATAAENTSRVTTPLPKRRRDRPAARASSTTAVRSREFHDFDSASLRKVRAVIGTTPPTARPRIRFST
jgi:hypothetical protein